MPSPETIVAGLRFASVRFIPLAVIWHVVLLTALILLIRGSRPSRRVGATVMALPMLSAGAVAFAVGNPFNARCSAPPARRSSFWRGASMSRPCSSDRRWRGQLARR